MRFVVLVALTLMVSGCGVAYISPKVPANSPNVDVVRLDAATVASANRSTYTPKTLPAAFFQTAGTDAGIYGVGSSPEPVVERQIKPTALPMRTPPSAPVVPYRVGVGDVLLLSSPDAGNTVEELSGLLAAQNRRQGYTVQDDGAIAVPDVGRIKVAGLTLEEAEAQVFQRLISSQMDPSFSLEVSEFNSKRVSVGGAVSKPAVVPITLVSLTLEEALAAAGGISTRDEDYTLIRLYRDGELYEVPLTEYLKRPGVQKTRLAAGDSIFVDTTFELEDAQAFFTEQIALATYKQDAQIHALNQMNSAMNLRRSALEEARSNFLSRLELDSVDRDFVYLTGEVKTPSRFPLPFGKTASLADALFENGGSQNMTANPARVYVLRGQPGSDRITAYNLNYRDATNLVLATKFQMRPNDVVFLSEQPITKWNRVVQQLVPSLLTSSATLAAN